MLQRSLQTSGLTVLLINRSKSLQQCRINLLHTICDQISKKVTESLDSDLSLDLYWEKNHCSVTFWPNGTNSQNDNHFQGSECVNFRQSVPDLIEYFHSKWQLFYTQDHFEWNSCHFWNCIVFLKDQFSEWLRTQIWVKGVSQF